MAESPEPFDIYTNGLQITSSPWDFTIEFFIRRSGDPKAAPDALGTVRMSPQHALILARLLQKQVDIFQESVGRISLPPKLYNDLGLEE